jgi:F-type H+-transporting ATPase subunit delta
MEGSLARRYATAIVETAVDHDEQTLGVVTAELEEFAKMVRESKDLEHLLMSPVFTLPERQRAIAAVLERVKPSALTKRFLTLLVERNRFGVFDDIVKMVRRLADQRAGKMRAEVVSASPLSKDAAASLKRALEKRTGKQVEMEVKIDPALLGGVRAQIGSMVLDGTLRTQLDQLRDQLLRAE